MDNRQIELCKYRIQEAEDSLMVAKKCLKDDFYIASKEKAEEQVETASMVMSAVKVYLNQYGIE